MMRVIPFALTALFLLTGTAWSAEKACGRFEILKATESVVWRLDRETGEIAACQFRDGALVCGSSSKAVERTGVAYADLQKARKEERQEKQEEKMAMLDKFLEIFRSILGMVKEMEGASGQ